MMACASDSPSNVLWLHGSYATDTGMMGLISLTGRDRWTSRLESRERVKKRVSKQGILGKYKREEGASHWRHNRHLITSQ